MVEIKNRHSFERHNLKSRAEESQSLEYYQTRYSPYGYGCDVRESFSHLPCQFFWTWLSGKEHKVFPKRHPRETLLTTVQLILQLLYSWSVIWICLVIGYFTYHASLDFLFKMPIYIGVWLLVTNRTRGLLHTFHYTNHGASIKSKGMARFLATWCMSVPIMHLSWENYFKIHAVQHHGPANLCSDEDPDEVFMLEHGFYKNMPEWKFWLVLIFAPFHPRAMFNHIAFRFMENFVRPGRKEIFYRASFWIVLSIVILYFDVVEEFMLFYIFPLFIVTQFSSWLQHVTEHMWFSKNSNEANKFIYYGSLTWARFLGRPYPNDIKLLPRITKRVVWFLFAFFVDIPVKLFSFMQDLPSHDYHHRSPLVNFWSIARERRAAENKKSIFGPMTEAWGMKESILIVRDSICYGKHDPFDVLTASKSVS